MPKRYTKEKRPAAMKRQCGESRMQELRMQATRLLAEEAADRQRVAVLAAAHAKEKRLRRQGIGGKSVAYMEKMKAEKQAADDHT